MQAFARSGGVAVKKALSGGSQLGGTRVQLPQHDTVMYGLHDMSESSLEFRASSPPVNDALVVSLGVRTGVLELFLWRPPPPEPERSTMLVSIKLMLMPWHDDVVINFELDVLCRSAASSALSPQSLGT